MNRQEGLDFGSEISHFVFQGCVDEFLLFGVF